MDEEEITYYHKKSIWLQEKGNLAQLEQSLDGQMEFRKGEWVKDIYFLN